MTWAEMDGPVEVTHAIKVLSLGAGVQSTALLLMSLAGEIERPDCAIFADTGWEPQAVYRHLEWLESTTAGRIPIHRVSAGNIRDASLARKHGKRWAAMPLYVRGQDGTPSTLRRQCTQEFKIAPIERKIRDLLGVAKGQRVRKGGRVQLWFGISLDEVHRMKPNKTPWIDNHYPLIERGLSRYDCLMWLQKHGYHRPPKSSCIGCPYHDDGYWRNLREESPAEWLDACQFDAEIRNGMKGVLQEAYLHRSLTPLAMADIRPKNAKRGQMELDMFAEECEGHCGL